MSMHVHMGDASSLVPLYMISTTNIYYGDHVIQYQHILWWPRDAVNGPLVTGVH